MIKNTFLFVALFLSVNSLLSQELDYPRLGVGIQTNFPAGGLSVKADLTERHSAQAVIGLFGPFSSYYGRYLYNFNENGEEFKYKPYLVGQAGFYSYDYQTFNSSYQVVEDTETSFGYGIGAGLESYYLPFTNKIRLNIELGYGIVSFDSYNFNSLFFGGGIHYYFDI